LRPQREFIRSWDEREKLKTGTSNVHAWREGFEGDLTDAARMPVFTVVVIIAAVWV
jgi:hypothetical protein